jgi:hypothetical protein
LRQHAARKRRTQAAVHRIRDAALKAGTGNQFDE